MRIKLYIDCDNAAFTEEGIGQSEEIKCILKDFASDLDQIMLDDLVHYEDHYNLHDHNGNTVGRVEVTK